jgi:hypothetical protein
MSTAEDYISMFERGESKDDLELSYHCSSPALSLGEGEESDLAEMVEETPHHTGTLPKSPLFCGINK